MEPLRDMTSVVLRVLVASFLLARVNAELFLEPAGTSCEASANSVLSVTSEAACHAAMQQLGPYGLGWGGVENDADWPKGCYVCQGCQSEGTYFNQHATGSTESDSSPYCWKESEPALIPGRTLFLGDSDIDYWNSKDQFPDSYNMGIAGHTCQQVLDELPATLTMYKPAGWVVLVCGENDIDSKASSATTAFGHFRQIIDLLLVETRVLFISTKPEPGTTSLHATYQFYDLLVRSMATATTVQPPPLVMIDSYQGFVNLGNPSSFYDTDDLHMSSEGYGYWKMWAQLAMYHSGNCVVWTNGQCNQSVGSTNRCTFSSNSDSNGDGDGNGNATGSSGTSTDTVDGDGNATGSSGNSADTVDGAGNATGSSGNSTDTVDGADNVTHVVITNAADRMCQASWSLFFFGLVASATRM